MNTFRGTVALLGVLVCAFVSVASAAPVEPVYSLVQKEKPAVIDTLRELVTIESGSRDAEGLGKLADRLRDRLAALGGKIEMIESGADRVQLHDTPATIGKTVVARFEGTGTRKILLLAHMDTVYPPGTLANRPFRVEGARAYGPGIADDKGGIALILHALAILKALDFREYQALTVAINGDEEISSPGSRHLITRLGGEHDFVFSCEPTLVSKDGLALATSGIAAASLTVRGRAAHAGVNPELGRNALIELSHQLLGTRDLSDPSRGVKFNWTMAKAGTTRNVIPDEATAVADVRVQRLADYEATEQAFRERVKTTLIEDTQVEANFERRRPPLEVTPASRAIGQKAQAIYGELGKQLGYDDSGRGGGTDAAFAALSGKAAVVEGFGLAGFGYHSSEEEYVDLDSVEPRLYLLVRLIMDTARGQ
jgi:glutamate carboxypeptidase